MVITIEFGMQSSNDPTLTASKDFTINVEVIEEIINECQPELTLPEIPDQITVTQGDDDNVITLENASNNNCRFVVELFD